MSTEDKKNEQGHGTTGHSWDGIEEWNNPLPRWWVWTFYATALWGIIYTILYPAWPLIDHATKGVWGYSTRAEVAADIQAFEDQNAAINAQLASADLTTLASNTELQTYAVNAGSAVFKTWCAQCHGAGAAGAVGYPNLNDDEWLWGGDIDAIATTIRYGIRSTSDDTHFSQMPAFGEFLEKSDIDAVVQYVLQVSNQDHDAGLAAAGATVFADNCSSCHGEDGKGDLNQGAPDLTNAIWLYGGDSETLTETVTKARFGVMPNWDDRLSDAQINAVAAYVHSRGGGQ